MSGLTGWFGGKNNMSEWIYSYIPKNIKVYVEPFSGSFPIFFNEDFSHVDNIIYNDANKLQVNFMKCGKEYRKFLEYLEKSFQIGGFLYCDKTNIDEIKKHYRDLYTKTKDGKLCDFYDNLEFEFVDFNRGVIYAFMITSAFNSCYARGAGFSGYSGGKLKVNTLLNKLKNEKYHYKLDKLTHINNDDFEKCINDFDAEDTFFYIDAPYKHTNFERGTHNTDYGSHDSFGDGHERLAKLLQETKARWSMSYYFFPELLEWFPKDKYYWVEKEFFRSSASFSDSKDKKGQELLIMNYNPETGVKIS